MMKVDIQFTVTDSAAEEIKKVIEEGNMVRVAVLSSGCSGTSYGLAAVEAGDVDAKNDVVEELNGVVFVADKASAMLLDQVVLDHNSEGFVFENPKVKSCCRKKGGCSRE